MSNHRQNYKVPQTSVGPAVQFLLRVVGSLMAAAGAGVLILSMVFAREMGLTATTSAAVGLLLMFFGVMLAKGEI